MQIKGENGDSEIGGGNSNSNAMHGLDNLNSGRAENNLNDTGLSSTFKSIDLPPKEYEQQLQQYEAEVRNHIKVQQ
jgi:DNA-binding transcriptional MerR regulator